jgi:hypothetical protein
MEVDQFSIYLLPHILPASQIAVNLFKLQIYCYKTNHYTESEIIFS